jgi:xylan 1,4-beta-xylosidase
MSTTVDVAAPTRQRSRLAQRGIASCHAYLSLREDYRDHFRLVQKEIGFERIRFHGIFLDTVGVYTLDSRGRPRLNFQTVDRIYDFFISQGVRPIVELGFMPEALASGTQTAFAYKGNVTPPRDMAQWEWLIEHFARHLVERYGLEEVRSWDFEVWNEPNLDYFWPGADMQAYFELYRASAQALRRADPLLRVGGPATARCEWIPEMLRFCASNDLPLDFISTHHYCTRAALEMGEGRGVVYDHQAKMGQDAAAVARDAANAGRADTPIWFTEWNVSPCHEDTIGKDSEFTATFALQTLIDVDPYVDGYCLWTFTDVFEESGPTRTPFSGKYGLVNLHGIRKPVFHAFAFLSKLFDHELSTDQPSLIATRSHRGDIRLLAWNLDEPTRADFAGGEWDFPGRSREDRLVLEGLNGPCRVRAWSVNRTHANAFRAWQAMGKPEYLTEQQTSDLHAASRPVLVEDRLVHCEGLLQLDYTLTGNAMRYYDIQRLGAARA